MTEPAGVFSSLRGVVQTLEQKSGINPLLFVDAIFGIPSVAAYAISGKAILLCFVWVPLLATVLFYGIAFFVDRNFLRSETHVREMRQLDILGEKGKEVSSDIIEVLPDVSISVAEKTPKKNPKLIDDGDKDAE